MRVALGEDAKAADGARRPSLQRLPHVVCDLLRRGRVGEEGRGVAAIIEMVVRTRLDCVLGSAALMREAVAQVLTQQTPLAPDLTGDDIQHAFQSSGLFLESSLATAAASATGSVPDLKAALISHRLLIDPRLRGKPGRPRAVSQ